MNWKALRINMKLNCDQNPDIEGEKKTTIEGRKDNSKQIWNVIVWYLWIRDFKR